jgi:hypothetical protein
LKVSAGDVSNTKPQSLTEKTNTVNLEQRLLSNTKLIEEMT